MMPAPRYLTMRETTAVRLAPGDFLEVPPPAPTVRLVAMSRPGSTSGGVAQTTDRPGRITVTSEREVGLAPGTLLGRDEARLGYLSCPREDVGRHSSSRWRLFAAD